LRDDFCGPETDCGPGLCCGKATSYDEDGWEYGIIHVCNDANANEWMDHLDWETLYTFQCLAGSAGKIGAAIAVLTTALYISA